jgi:hypothetical protein
MLAVTSALLLFVLAINSRNENGDGSDSTVDVAINQFSAISPMPLEVLTETERFLPSSFVDDGTYMDFALQELVAVIAGRESAAVNDGWDIMKYLQEHAPSALWVTESGASSVDIAQGASELEDVLDFAVFFPPLQAAAFRRLMQHRHHRPDPAYMAGIGHGGRVSVPRRLGTNLEIAGALCDLTLLFSNRSVTCSPATSQVVKIIRELAKGAKKSINGGRDLSPQEMERLFAAASKSDLVAERARISSSGFKPNSLAIRSDGQHALVSPVGAGQFLCTGVSSGAAVFAGGGRLHASNVKHKSMLGSYDTALLGVHGPELLETIATQLSVLDPSPRAEELLLTKLRVWDPLRAARLTSKAVSYRDAARLVMRPTLLCAILTYEGPEGLDLALMQRALWGRHCDEHIIFVASTAGKSKAEKVPPISQQRRHAAGATPSFPDSIVLLKIADEVQKKKRDGSYYPNMWQLFREVVSWLEMSSRTENFAYVYFGFEDNYVIPQNLYLMLLQKDIYAMNGLSTPLFLGHRMVASIGEGRRPDQEAPQERLAYASAGPGFILNSVALALLQTLVTLDGCFPNNASNAVDLLLASCFELAGVPARDTADLLGQDRMHVLSLHWLLQAPRFAKAGAGARGGSRGGVVGANRSTTSSLSGGSGGGKLMWWYAEHHQRALQPHLDNPYRSLSTTSFSFNKVNTPSKALWMHLQLFPHHSKATPPKT